MNSNLIQVWPTSEIRKVMTGRRLYVDSEGNTFTGTHREAKTHFAILHSTKSVQLNTIPRKRK